jgi:hypothetical protein
MVSFSQDQPDSPVPGGNGFLDLTEQDSATGFIVGLGRHADAVRRDDAVVRRALRVLALVDCKVLDHIVVLGTSAVSFAERGLL